MSWLTRCRTLTYAGLLAALLVATGPDWARAAAIITTSSGSNQILVYPSPNPQLPDPTAIPVSGLPADARPHGVSCFDDTCLVADNGHFRIFVIQVSTASLVSTIETTARYAGGGTLAVNPQRTHALAVDPYAFIGLLTVIAAPFTPGATITQLPLNGVLAGGTQTIAFAPSGRAFVCEGGAVAVFDPPYATRAFTLAVPPQSGCSELAVSPDGNTLLAPFAKQVNIWSSPTPGTSPVVLPVPGSDLLAGAAFTPDGAKALVVDQNGDAVWVASAPLNASSSIEKITLSPLLFPNFRQIAISPDNQLAILTGGGASTRSAFIRPPFTSAAASVFDVLIEGGVGFGGVTFLGPAGPPGPTLVTLFAAILPSSRSVRVGTPATAFVTVINAGTETATSVGIAPVSPVPVIFTFQTTNPATNALTGTPNTPVNIGPGQLQTFLIALTPQAPIFPTEVAFSFAGANTVPVAPLVGINTLLLSASASDVPDIVALAATQGNNGIVDVSAATGNSGAFAVATVNVGLGATITIFGDTGDVALPLTVFVCQTNLQGGCLQNPAPTVTAFIDSNATPTFAFFVVAQGPVNFNPSVNRIFARFKDSGGVTRGSTSVAVRTVP